MLAAIIKEDLRQQVSSLRLAMVGNHHLIYFSACLASLQGGGYSEPLEKAATLDSPSSLNFKTRAKINEAG
jgi:hypothetical protein